MGKIVQYALSVFAVVAIAGIIFVKAGRNNKQSGGQQTAAIISSFGQAASSVTNSLTN